MEQDPRDSRRIPARIGLMALLIFVMACGGGQGSAPSIQEAPPPSSAPPPLVDSRGRPAPAVPSGADTTAQGELAWDDPEGWTSTPPSSAMRRAQYSLPRAAGDAADGECAVFFFGPGQGGDLRSNVDRWASQFTLPSGDHPKPVESEETVAGMKVHRIRLEGTYNASTMMGGDGAPQPGSVLLGAIVEGPGSHWFFKCTGLKRTMESHQAGFDALIRSLHAH